jgi:hypothetical protein
MKKKILKTDQPRIGMDKSVEYPKELGIANRPGAYILVGRSSIQITERVCKEVTGERI